MEFSGGLKECLTPKVLEEIDKMNLQYVYDCIRNKRCCSELTDWFLTEADVDPIYYFRYAVPQFYAWRSDKIETVYIPSNIRQLHATCFAESTVTSVSMESGVQVVDATAFFQCQKLTEVFLPYTIKQIGPNAFDGCCNLETVCLPKDVELCAGAFNNCGEFTIHFDGTVNDWNKLKNKPSCFYNSTPTVKCLRDMTQIIYKADTYNFKIDYMQS